VPKAETPTPFLTEHVPFLAGQVQKAKETTPTAVEAKAPEDELPPVPVADTPTSTQSVQIEFPEEPVPTKGHQMLEEIEVMESVMPQVDDDYDDILDGMSIKSPEEELSWSSEKPHPMSDWKFVVGNLQAKTKQTYFVHKLVLSTGPTKSEHFEKLFRTFQRSNVTEVTFSKSASLAFPALLDFLYSREDVLDVRTENAVALRYLGRVYGIRKLVVRCTTFIRDDLSHDKSLHYLNAGAEFDDKKVMATSSQCCAANITLVDRDGLTDLEPPLFSLVVSCEKVACSSEELSRIVGEFSRKHEDVMDASLLRVVTHPKNMPVVCPSETVYLLQKSEQHEPNDDKKSDLQQRCILSCSTAWNGTLVGQLVWKSDSYAKISPELKVNLLEDSLVKAKKDFDTGLQAKVSAKDDEISTRDSHIAKLKKTTDSLHKEISVLRKELSKFKRLPAEYEFPKKKKMYTYLPAREKFGTERPTAMPRNVSASEQGYIYPEVNSRWPVFYFKGE